MDEEEKKVNKFFNYEEDNENELKKRLIVNICIFILMWIVTIVLLYMKKNF